MQIIESLFENESKNKCSVMVARKKAQSTSRAATYFKVSSGASAQVYLIEFNETGRLQKNQAAQNLK